MCGVYNLFVSFITQSSRFSIVQKERSWKASAYFFPMFFAWKIVPNRRCKEKNYFPHTFLTLNTHSMVKQCLASQMGFSCSFFEEDNLKVRTEKTQSLSQSQSHIVLWSGKSPEISIINSIKLLLLPRVYNGLLLLSDALYLGAKGQVLKILLCVNVSSDAM